MRRKTHFALFLLILCLCFADCASVDATADSDTSAYSADAADVALISEKMEISYADAREIYDILRESGLGEGVKYVTAWTDKTSGERYYRVRTAEDFFDFYPTSRVVRDRDGNVVFGADPDVTETDTAVSDGETASDETLITLILNTNTKKYHYPGCRSIKTMKESNKKEVLVADVSEVHRLGYVPCALCAADDSSEDAE